MRITDILAGLAIVLWLGAVGAGVLIYMQNAQGQKVKNARTIILSIIVGALIITTLAAGLVFIEPEERGIVISALAPKGYREDILQPGLRFVVPFVERVVTYQISKQTYTMSATAQEGQHVGDDSISARTKDGQEVFIDASVLYEVDPNKIVQVHIQWQNRYGEDLVRAQARGIIRDGVSQFGVEEVVSDKRFEMVKYVTSALEQKLSDNGLILVDFVLRNITFSTEYAASVEQKQIAEQQAKQAAYVVQSKIQEAQQAIETAKGQKEAAIISAEGQAEARLIQVKAEADALNQLNAVLAGHPELLTYQYITKLSPTIQTMLLPSGSPFIFQLPNITGTSLSSTK
jgi:regulator of protease activity HflC (stomatin/prohibitin superfamily)